MTAILKVDTIQDTSGNNIINESSDTITIGASGDTITIPSGATITNSGTASGFGITEADQWRITANHSGVAVITANWERVDTYSYSQIGTGMTESSGIFSFPSTGIYRIDFYATSLTSGGSTGFLRGDIDHTEDNGTYNTASVGYSGIYTDGAYSNISIFSIFDVTNVSTHKVRFELGQNSSATPIFTGSTSQTRTSALFTRLGDT
jgi:hypothetical protein